MENRLLVSAWKVYKNYVRGTLLSQNDGDIRDISYWRNETFCNILTYFAPLSIIALIPGIYMAFKNGLWVVGFTDLIAFALTITITLTNNLTLRLRKFILIFILYSVSVVLLYYLNVASPGLLFLLTIPIFSVVIYSSAAARYTAVINSIICIFFGALIYLKVNISLTANHNIGTWIAISSNLIFLSFVCAGCLNLLITGLEASLNDTLSAEKRFKISNSRLLFHMENTPLGYIDWESTLTIRSWSKRAEEIFGWTKEEFSDMLKDGLKPVYVDDLAPVNKMVLELTDGTLEKNTLQCRLYTKQGKLIWCEWFNSTLKNKAGKTTAVQTFFHDITQQKQQEYELALSESNLKAIIESTDAFIYSLDSNFRYITFNLALANSVKQMYNVEVKVGDNVFDFLEKSEPEEAKFWNKTYAEALTGKAIRFEKEFRAGNYSNTTTFTINPIFENGKVMGLSCFAADITDHKKAEQKIKELNEKLELQSELSQQIDALNNSAIVTESDTNGNITFANNNFCKISGYSQEEVIGKNHRILKSGKQSDSLFNEMWQVISSGKTWRGEILNKNKVGGYYWVYTSIVPFKNLKEKTYKFVSIQFDVTRQKEQQDFLEKQTTELKLQQDELEASNIELEAGSERLQLSEEELIESNRELEEKSYLLEDQYNQSKIKATQLESISHELKLQTEALILSNKYKSEFLANMSHELRTPLNSILLLSKLLSNNREKNLTNEQVQFAKVMHNSGTGLLGLINNILDLSKVESGNMEMEIMNMEMETVLNTITGLFNPLFKEKGVPFSIMSNEGIPAIIKSDPTRVEQVLKNLLANALKFTDTGSVELIVRAPVETEVESMRLDAHKFIAFEVKDTGIGIPDEKQSLVFESFQQADSSTSRIYGGTGLGLSISLRIARLLGGDIILESTPGKGSSFTLVIPVDSTVVNLGVHNHIKKVKLKSNAKKPNYAGMASRQKTASSNPTAFQAEEVEKPKTPMKSDFKDRILQHAHILIIGDDLSYVYSLTKLLESHGVKVSAGKDGFDAIEMLERDNTIDLLLLDIMMPYKDGYEALQAIRNKPEFKELPIIAVTAKTMPGDREACIKEGANDFITKPVDEEQLISLLKVWLTKMK